MQTESTLTGALPPPVICDGTAATEERYCVASCPLVNNVGVCDVDTGVCTCVLPDYHCGITNDTGLDNSFLPCYCADTDLVGWCDSTQVCHCYCGNGEIDNVAAEECDVGATEACDNHQKCDFSSCACIEACGDNIIDSPDEDCDGSNDSMCPGLCRPRSHPNPCTCPPPVCGNNSVEVGETCDGSSKDACGGRDCIAAGQPGECTCKPPECGDGIKNQGSEQCDGSDRGICPVGVGCTLGCQCQPYCGDGSNNQASEECDGSDDRDCGPTGCYSDTTGSNACQCRPYCGDGDIDPGETCDPDDTPGPDWTPCRLPTATAACTSCGDNQIQSAAGEECDGTASGECTHGCTLGCTCKTYCGDGVRQNPNDSNFPEECDGNNEDCGGRVCKSNCTCEPPRCGDGIVNDPETCDPNSSPPGGWDDCRLPTATDACTSCGDGDIQTASGEECDDENSDNTDDCKNDCTEPVCGDGILSSTEACEDGVAGGACPDALCINAGEIGACTCNLCGNGELDAGETCDVGAAGGACADEYCIASGTAGQCTCQPFCGDNNADDPNADGVTEECDGTDKDACAGDCATDCTCEPACGDGNVDAGETCDPDNTPGPDWDPCRLPSETDACTSCGDGTKQGSEACDGTDLGSCSACNDDCECEPTCGDNEINQDDEICDGTDLGICTDGCTNDCTCEPFCGDGNVDAGVCNDFKQCFYEEFCVLRDDNEDCLARVDTLRGAICSDEFDCRKCDITASPAVCQQTDYECSTQFNCAEIEVTCEFPKGCGEECDCGDGSTSCNVIVDNMPKQCRDCQIRECGNNRVEGNEECECEDGSTSCTVDHEGNEVACNSCKLAICGNRRVDDGEECDRGTECRNLGGAIVINGGVCDDNCFLFNGQCNSDHDDALCSPDCTSNESSSSSESFSSIEESSAVSSSEPSSVIASSSESSTDATSSITSSVIAESSLSLVIVEHTRCVNGACQIFPGTGPTECIYGQDDTCPDPSSSSTDSSISEIISTTSSSQGPQHTRCSATKVCEIVDGEGLNECGVGMRCIPRYCCNADRCLEVYADAHPCDKEFHSMDGCLGWCGNQSSAAQTTIASTDATSAASEDESEYSSEASSIGPECTDPADCVDIDQCVFGNGIRTGVCSDGQQVCCTFPDECPNNADCLDEYECAPELSTGQVCGHNKICCATNVYAACEESACVPRVGNADNQCRPSEGCVNPHPECRNGMCVMVDGFGGAQCTPGPDPICDPTIGGSSSSPDDQDDDDDGDDDDGNSGGTGGGVSSTIVAYESSDPGNGGDTGGFIDEHTACQGKQCIVVQGFGLNECDPDFGCDFPTRSACRNGQCVEVDGAGGNECNTDAECRTPPPPANIGGTFGGGFTTSSSKTLFGSDDDDTLVSTDATTDHRGCITTFHCSRGICRDGYCVPCLRDDECLTGTCDDGICKDSVFVAAGSVCGNGILEPGEHCDDGNRNSVSPGATCRPDCSFSRCGDAILSFGEECEDGNNISGDGCDPNCKKEKRSPLLAAAPPTPPAQAPLPQLQVPVPVPSPFIPTTQLPPAQYPFPQIPNMQNLPAALPLAQLRPIIQTRAPIGDTGPAAVAIIGAGAAAGIGWVRRRKR